MIKVKLETEKGQLWEFTGKSLTKSEKWGLGRVERKRGGRKAGEGYGETGTARLRGMGRGGEKICFKEFGRADRRLRNSDSLKGVRRRG